MRRRDVLAGIGTASASALAGCAGITGAFETRSARVPPVVSDRPRAVYVPSHVEGMEMVGTERDRGYEVALSYTFPHRFWTTQAGRGTERVSVRAEDSIHLMVSVWHAESGVYVTDAAPTITVTRDGRAVVGNNNPWAMLSQQMGFHYGDNVALAGEGTYTVTVETSGPTTPRMGSLSGADGRASVEFTLEFSRSTLEDLPYRSFTNSKGSRGAADPMKMLPLAYAPEREDLPGTVLGEATSGDATLLVTTVTRDGSPYLAVSPRTPHNRFVLPQMSLQAAVTRDDTIAAQAPLTAALDPGLNFHYGASIDVRSGDRLTISVQAPPQVARHEGYETAFLEMDPVELTA